jgi:hypothetical protein
MIEKGKDKERQDDGDRRSNDKEMLLLKPFLDHDHAPPSREFNEAVSATGTDNVHC